MRDIYFRGKRIDTKTWVYGDLLQQADFYGKGKTAYFIDDEFDVAGHCFSHFPHRVIGETVGQYTGLTDNNGVKIFEGDIVHIYDVTLKRTDPWHEFDGYVAFADGSYCIVSGSASHDRWFRYYVDVIGNAHDNPELLEGG